MCQHHVQRLVDFVSKSINHVCAFVYVALMMSGAEKVMDGLGCNEEGKRWGQDSAARICSYD